jgi:hypothetical protein
MNHTPTTSAFAVVACVVLALGAGGCVAQLEEGDVYAAPRTQHDTPNLQGIWQVLNSANVNVLGHPASLDGPAGQSVVEGNEIPYQESALAKQQENFANRRTEDPERKCFLPGVPRTTYLPYPFEIVQTPGMVTILYEFAHAQRRIYTDGTPHTDEIEYWMGDSRGHWEDDTLVVDVTNHNDMTWFDRAGNFHSNELHVIERYTRIDEDHINYEATIEDPKVFTRPWTMQMLLYRRAETNAQVLEYQCYAFEENTPGLSVPLFRESPIQ